MFISFVEKRQMLRAGRWREIADNEGPIFHTIDGYHNQIAANVIQIANNHVRTSGDPVAALRHALDVCCDDASPLETRHRKWTVGRIHVLQAWASPALAEWRQ